MMGRMNNDTVNEASVARMSVVISSYDQFNGVKGNFFDRPCISKPLIDCH